MPCWCSSYVLSKRLWTRNTAPLPRRQFSSLRMYVILFRSAFSCLILQPIWRRALSSYAWQYQGPGGGGGGEGETGGSGPSCTNFDEAFCPKFSWTFRENASCNCVKLAYGWNIVVRGEVKLQELRTERGPVWTPDATCRLLIREVDPCNSCACPSNIRRQISSYRHAPGNDAKYDAYKTSSAVAVRQSAVSDRVYVLIYY
jgi:hypothetical protein